MLQNFTDWRSRKCFPCKRQSFRMYVCINISWPIHTWGLFRGHCHIQKYKSTYNMKTSVMTNILKDITYMIGYDWLQRWCHLSGEFFKSMHSHIQVTKTITMAVVQEVAGAISKRSFTMVISGTHKIQMIWLPSGTIEYLVIEPISRLQRWRTVSCDDLI